MFTADIGFIVGELTDLWMRKCQSLQLTNAQPCKLSIRKPTWTPVAPMIVGAPHAAYREGVLANLATAHAMAKVVFAVELDADSCDLAGVFTPMAAEPLTSQDT
jgi:hypothetical protein